MRWQTYLDGVFTGAFVTPGLRADTQQIPADGTTPAKLHYAAPELGPHLWSVNGVTHTELAALDIATSLHWSEIEVTALVPGPVVVTVGGETSTIEAL